MQNFKKGQYIKNRACGDFSLILEELGDLRFLSYNWTDKKAAEQQSTKCPGFPPTLKEMNEHYIEVTAEEATGIKPERKLENGDIYFYVSDRGDIKETFFSPFDDIDKFHLASHNFFRTEAEALTHREEMLKGE